uniref:Secreted protein n=1 Tax=Anopheles atroparvus TaxID=41427 RepID=A0AAG5D2Q7_ANOAO
MTFAVVLSKAILLVYRFSGVFAPQLRFKKFLGNFQTNTQSISHDFRRTASGVLQRSGSFPLPPGRRIPLHQREHGKPQKWTWLEAQVKCGFVIMS